MQSASAMLIIKISASATPENERRTYFSYTRSLQQAESFLADQVLRDIAIDPSLRNSDSIKNHFSYLSLGKWDYVICHPSNDLYSISRYSSYLSYQPGIRGLSIFFCFDDCHNPSDIIVPLSSFPFHNAKYPIMCLVECKFHPMNFAYSNDNMSLLQNSKSVQAILDFQLRKINNELKQLVLKDDFDILDNVKVIPILPINWADCGYIIFSNDIFLISLVIKAIRSLRFNDVYDDISSIREAVDDRYLQGLSESEILRHHIFSSTVSFINFKLINSNNRYSLDQANISSSRVQIRKGCFRKSRLYHPKLNIWLSIHPGHEESIYDAITNHYSQYLNKYRKKKSLYYSDRFVFGEKDLLFTPKAYLDNKINPTLQLTCFLNEFLELFQAKDIGKISSFINSISSDIEILHNFRSKEIDVLHENNQYNIKIAEILEDRDYFNLYNRVLKLLDSKDISKGNINALNNFAANLIQLIKDSTIAPFYLDYLELYLKVSVYLCNDQSRIETSAFNAMLAEDLQLITESMNEFYRNSFREGEASDLGALFKGGYQNILHCIRSYIKNIFRQLQLDYSVNMILTPKMQLSIVPKEMTRIAHIVSEANSNLFFYDLPTMIHEAGHLLKRSREIDQSYCINDMPGAEETWEEIFADIVMIKAFHQALIAKGYSNTVIELNGVALYAELIIIKIAEKALTEPDCRIVPEVIGTYLYEIIFRYHMMLYAALALNNANDGSTRASIVKRCSDLAKRIFEYYFSRFFDTELFRYDIADYLKSYEMLCQRLFNSKADNDAYDFISRSVSQMDISFVYDGSSRLSTILEKYTEIISIITREFAESINWIERDKYYERHNVQKCSLPAYRYGNKESMTEDIYFYNTGDDIVEKSIFLDRNAYFFFKSNHIKDMMLSKQKELYGCMLDNAYGEYWLTMNKILNKDIL